MKTEGEWTEEGEQGLRDKGERESKGKEVEAHWWGSGETEERGSSAPKGEALPLPLPRNSPGPQVVAWQLPHVGLGPLMLLEALTPV